MYNVIVRTAISLENYHFGLDMDKVDQDMIHAILKPLHV